MPACRRCNVLMRRVLQLLGQCAGRTSERLQSRKGQTPNERSIFVRCKCLGALEIASDPCVCGVCRGPQSHDPTSSSSVVRECRFEAPRHSRMFSASLTRRTQVKSRGEAPLARRLPERSQRLTSPRPFTIYHPRIFLGTTTCSGKGVAHSRRSPCLGNSIAHFASPLSNQVRDILILKLSSAP